MTARKGAGVSDNTESGWNDELMTTRELMAFLKMSRTKVWELVQSSELPAFKLGGDYRYRRSERWKPANCNGRQHSGLHRYVF